MTHAPIHLAVAACYLLMHVFGLHLYPLLAVLYVVMAVSGH